MVQAKLRRRRVVVEFIPTPEVQRALAMRYYETTGYASTEDVREFAQCALVQAVDELMEGVGMRRMGRVV